jgi:hypothetical protein
MNRIFVTGDCHGTHDYAKLSTSKWPEGKLLDRDDYVIVTGDMGLVWSNDPDDPKEDYLKDWYGVQKPWTTLFACGNHENHDMLYQLPTKEMFGSEVGVVCENVYHLKRGNIYKIHDSTFFVMGGAVSIDKHHRTEGLSWWKYEVPTYTEFDHGIESLEKYNWKVDYIITHTCPDEVIPLLGFSRTIIDPVSTYLNHIAKNTKYNEWYFGHFHTDKDLGRYHCVYDRIIQIR